MFASTSRGALTTAVFGDDFDLTKLVQTCGTVALAAKYAAVSGYVYVDVFLHCFNYVCYDLWADWADSYSSIGCRSVELLSMRQL
jgi:hypothetical protein